MMPKRAVEWHRHEYHTSECGAVELNSLGEWSARVTMPSGEYARIRETFVSLEVAKGAVERTWKRENER